MTSESNFDDIRNLTENWVMLFRKLAKRAEKNGYSNDVIASSVINTISKVFVELVLHYDQGYHDRLLNDLVQTIAKNYQLEKPEPEKRIITLN